MLLPRVRTWILTRVNPSILMTIFRRLPEGCFEELNMVGSALTRPLAHNTTLLPDYVKMFSHEFYLNAGLWPWQPPCHIPSMPIRSTSSPTCLRAWLRPWPFLRRGRRSMRAITARIMQNNIILSKCIVWDFHPPPLQWPPNWPRATGVAMVHPHGHHQETFAVPATAVRTQRILPGVCYQAGYSGICEGFCGTVSSRKLINCREPTCSNHRTQAMMTL